MTGRVKAIRTYFVVYSTREHHFRNIRANNRRELRQLIMAAVDEGAETIKVKEKGRAA